MESRLEMCAFSPIYKFYLLLKKAFCFYDIISHTEYIIFMFQMMKKILIDVYYLIFIITLYFLLVFDTSGH